MNFPRSEPGLIAAAAPAPRPLTSAYAIRVLVVALAYVVTAKAGLALAYENSSVTAVWAPSGIALAALVLWGRGLWPGVALGAFFANAWTGVPLTTELGITTGNTLAALVGATLLLRVGDFRPSLERARDVLMLVVLAAGLSTMVSATVGLLSLYAGGALDTDTTASTWRTWWLGDAGGDLLVATFLMVFATGRRAGHRPRRLLETLGLLIALVAVSWFVFSAAEAQTFLVFPALGWAALRFGQRGVTAGSLIVAGIAIGFTANGSGPFADAAPDAALLAAQIFVGLSAIVMLLLAALEAEQKQVQHALRTALDGLQHAEERFRSAFDVAPIGMAVMDDEGRFVRVNGALCELTGYSREQLEAASIESLTHPDDVGEVHERLKLMIAGEPSPYKVDQRFVNASGQALWVALHATVLNVGIGEPARFLAQMLDISERHRVNEELQRLADQDPLTGLSNRRSFERALQLHLERGRRYGMQGAVLVLDLDQLKAVNDSLGHNAGDKLIVGVARALGERLRDTDELARLGGDEFAILVPTIDPDGAWVLGCDLADAVREQEVWTPDRRPLAISASIGVAMIEEAGVTGQAVMANADRAMYAAKHAGRDRVAFHQPGAPWTEAGQLASA